MQHSVAARLRVHDDQIFHVAESRNGTLWLSTAAGLARKTGDSIYLYKPYGTPGALANRTYEDADGNTRVAANQGLYLATPTSLEPLVTGIHVRYIVQA